MEEPGWTVRADPTDGGGAGRGRDPGGAESDTTGQQSQDRKSKAELLARGTEEKTRAWKTGVTPEGARA